LREAISKVSIDVHDFITKPTGGQNVTEWCKKEACWSRLKSLELHYPDLSDILIWEVEKSPWRSVQSDNSISIEDKEIIHKTMTVSSDTWFQISRWAKETRNLMPWQRSLAVSLGKLANNNKQPSIKQAKQGLIILKESARLGFRTLI